MFQKFYLVVVGVTFVVSSSQAFAGMENTLKCKLTDRTTGKTVEMIDKGQPFPNLKLEASNGDLQAYAWSTVNEGNVDGGTISAWYIRLADNASGFMAESQGKLEKSEQGNSELFEKPSVSLGTSQKLIGTVECSVL